MPLHLALVQFYWYDQLPAWNSLLAKAKSHTHTLTSGVSHSSDKCALHTKEQESLHELYLLIHSLKESIHSKCNLKVHVKFHRMKSASRYTDYDQTVNLSIVMIAGPPVY